MWGRGNEGRERETRGGGYFKMKEVDSHSTYGGVGKNKGVRYSTLERCDSLRGRINGK